MNTAPSRTSRPPNPLQLRDLLAFRRCPKLLWLSVHAPEGRDAQEPDDPWAWTQADRRRIERRALFEEVRFHFDADDEGIVVEDLLDSSIGHVDPIWMLSATRKALAHRDPVFHGMVGDEALCAHVPALLPAGSPRSRRRWALVDVRSVTKASTHHVDRIAIQVHAAERMGLSVDEVGLLRLDGDWVYAGDRDLTGLFAQDDLTDTARTVAADVPAWMEAARATLRKRRAPDTAMGSQCTAPYLCPFHTHCAGSAPSVRHPIAWLPRGNKAREYAAETGVLTMEDVPDELLNRKQLRVKQATLSGKPYLNRAGAIAALEKLGGVRPPAYFLDFETIDWAIPRWKGTRPKEQVPFQASVHEITARGRLKHHAFLDETGADPTRALAEMLIAACGVEGPVFVYNASVEVGCLERMASRLPRRLAKPILAIAERIVDLLPVTREHYYHPDQQGSWSIKAVLPTIAQELDYETLEGVRNGPMAQVAYTELILPDTLDERKRELKAALLRYCERDTLALVRLWQHLTGQSIKER